VGGTKRLGPVHHQISRRCLINIENNDNNCLFLAMQATMVHVSQGYTRLRFHNYLHSKWRMAGRLQQDAMELKAAVGAPEQQEGYDATIWIPKIVDYWNNKKNGRRFKAFVFQASGT